MKLLSLLLVWSIGFHGVTAQDAEKCPPKTPAARAVGYGPLSPVKDLATGLELLELPEGFEYISYGWTGQVMHDGVITPTDHDGMGVVGQVSMARVRKQMCIDTFVRRKILLFPWCEIMNKYSMAAALSCVLLRTVRALIYLGTT